MQGEVEFNIGDAISSLEGQRAESGEISRINDAYSSLEPISSAHDNFLSSVLSDTSLTESYSQANDSFNAFLDSLSSFQQTWQDAENDEGLERRRRRRYWNRWK